MKKGYRYTESGLTNVWLANGYTIRNTKYGGRLRLIYVEHDRGNAPIRTTIQRINDMDAQGLDQIIAEAAKGGWKTRLAA